ncbi:helix-turn-helix domain-containing protein [Chitinophaga sp. SYP-B3965]|uniref:helix-turn-helix domain-containing protein n=1 Tax=Chitinophaga sp. SYP-B3965 TaxID=2663120 RepID=UPI001299C424|nr:AraC family transcriptional regulator [Chitinophaga sp. SYP-B3965]MRG48589.1 helix-turn-helix domain-containing protein [Chitinophaga sp. SYP-B3965]
MQETANYIYRNALPNKPLEDIIQCFWSVQNPTEKDQVYSILPDGYFDVIFHSVNGQPYKVSLSGLWTKVMPVVVPANSFSIGISFKLLAVDYLFKQPIASLLDKEQILPGSLWNIPLTDFDFDHFVKHALQQINTAVNKDFDNRKQLLFAILYSSHGKASAESISQTIHWSNRQISRYFKDRFGISLKAYSNILRYRASFGQLKEQQLYPEEGYADQAHFIRDVKKYSGVTPKRLAENKNGRFIQLSTLRKK